MNISVYFHRNQHFLCPLSGTWDGFGRLIVPSNNNTRFGPDGAGNSQHDFPRLSKEPDFRNGFSYELMNRLVHLPAEIRFQIYELVALAWNPQVQQPTTSPPPDKSGPLRETITIARRNTKPLFGPCKALSATSSMPDDARSRFINEWEFDRKGGMLDYFKDIEYIWLEEFIDALWRFEGRGKAIEKWYDRFTRDPKKEAERKLGVLEDFVGWFWGRVVVDLSWMKVVVDDGYKCPLHDIKYPNDHLRHHNRISHISLDLDLFWHETYQWPTLYIPSFLNRCAFITAHLPSLLSLILFIRLSVSQARFLLTNPTYDIDWIRAIRQIPVRDRWSLKVLVTNGVYDGEGLSGGELDELGEEVMGLLGDVLMPESLRDVGEDGDEDMVLGLFEE